MCDLKDLYTVDAHEEGGELPIIDPRTGILHGLVIILVGSDSETYMEADLDLHKARIEARKKEISAEEARDELVEKLVKCTKGWYGTTTPFSEEAARELYRKSPPVFSQVNAFIHDRKNFYRD